MRISDWSSDMCSSDLLRPDDNFARETYLNASDQLAVIRDGWELTERVPLRHETEPRAVLSVLAPSLQIMTGGYATRDRQSVVSGTSVCVRVALGGRRTFKTKQT